MIDRLHYISQEGPKGETHAEMVQLACQAGVKWVQLRIKDQSIDAILKQAQQARDICNDYDARLIINDHPEIAKQVNADGVHLGQQDMDAQDARKLLGDDFIIGGTCNTSDQLLELINKGVNYVGLGPFRFTSTKKKLSPILGLEGYESIIKRMRLVGREIPIIAIGGLDWEDITGLRAAGVHGVAMASAINYAVDARAVVDQLNKVLHGEFTNSR